MKRVTLGNRPVAVQPGTRTEDFDTGVGNFVRVSMKKVEAQSDRLTLSAQAYQVNAEGSYVPGPDGRPSRTQDTTHSINITGFYGEDRTHTLDPGWVRVVGDYDEANFESTALRGTAIPVGEPDWATNPTGQFFNTATSKGYRWDEGEALRIARSKAGDMQSIIDGSSIIAGIEF
jgi:hypothetical protein